MPQSLAVSDKDLTGSKSQALIEALREGRIVFSNAVRKQRRWVLSYTGTKELIGRLRRNV